MGLEWSDIGLILWPVYFVGRFVPDWLTGLLLIFYLIFLFYVARGILIFIFQILIPFIFEALFAFIAFIPVLLWRSLKELWRLAFTPENSAIVKLWRGEKIYPKDSRKRQSNSFSRIETKRLVMWLDRNSEEMNGRLKAGLHKNKILDNLTKEELFQVLLECYEFEHDDPRTVQILTSYLDQRYGGRWRHDYARWKVKDDSDSTGQQTFQQKKSYDEAVKLLGLPENNAFGPGELKKRYLKLMNKLHPDHDGSNLLAQMVGEAKTIIEKERGW